MPALFSNSIGLIHFPLNLMHFERLLPSFEGKNSVITIESSNCFDSVFCPVSIEVAGHDYCLGLMYYIYICFGPIY